MMGRGLYTSMNGEAGLRSDTSFASDFIDFTYGKDKDQGGNNSKRI